MKKVLSIVLVFIVLAISSFPASATPYPNDKLSGLDIYQNSYGTKNFTFEDFNITATAEELQEGVSLFVVCEENGDFKISKANDTNHSSRSTAVFNLILQNDILNGGSYFKWQLVVPWSIIDGQLTYVFGTLYAVGYSTQSIVSSPDLNGSQTVASGYQPLNCRIAPGTTVTVGYRGLGYRRVWGGGSFPNHQAQVVIK